MDLEAENHVRKGELAGIRGWASEEQKNESVLRH